MDKNILENSKVINLNWNNYHLSSLLRSNDKMYYKINGKNIISAAYDNCPIELIIKKNTKTDLYKEIDHIPSIFSDYYVSRTRKDIRKKLGIKPEDDYFNALYKVASNSELFIKEGFWISKGSLEKEKDNDNHGLNLKH